jgi:hypothetical protein
MDQYYVFYYLHKKYQINVGISRLDNKHAAKFLYVENQNCAPHVA